MMNSGNNPSHTSDVKKLFDHMCPANTLTVESGYVMSAMYQAEFIDRAQMRFLHIMIEDLFEGS